VSHGLPALSALMSASKAQLLCPLHFITVRCIFSETFPRPCESWGNPRSCSLRGRAVGLGGRLPSEGCQPCQAMLGQSPSPPTTFFPRTRRVYRPDWGSRVKVSLCRWGFRATSLPEKMNKNPSDILIMARLKIIPQHVDGCCHVHVDGCVRPCHLTFAV